MDIRSLSTHAFVRSPIRGLVAFKQARFSAKHTTVAFGLLLLLPLWIYNPSVTNHFAQVLRG
jgi:hypothetical protein